MKQALGYGLLALATTAVVNAEQKPLSSDNPLPSGPETRVKPQLPSDEALDGFVESLIDQLRVPGLSLVIVDGGEITSKGYGMAVLPDTKADGDTRYFGGSTTKAFLAAYMAMMVQDDEKYSHVEWTSPINSLIREDFVLGDEHVTSHTTIEDALSHRTGLGAHDMMFGQPGDTISKVVQRIRYLPLPYEPRTVFQYCNLGYGIVTDIVETLTGSKLEILLNEHIWKPLGMQSTSFDTPWLEEDQSDSTSSLSNLARGYYWDPVNKSDPFGKGRYLTERWYDISSTSGAGSIVSSVNDYALWVRALLDAFQERGNQSSPITASIFDDIVTPRTVVQIEKGVRGKSPPLYALGWVVSEVLGTTVVSHTGGLPGFGTCVYLFPAYDFGIVTMGNTMETSAIAGITITSKLILEKVGITTESHGKANYENVLVYNHQKLHSMGEKSLSRKVQLITDVVHNPADPPPVIEKDTLPLPGRIEDFAGTYSHPAYGSFNLSVVSSSDADTESSSSQEISLRGLLYPRTLSTRFDLVHVSDTMFTMTISLPHGTGDLTSEAPSDDLVWAPMMADMQAVFKFGLGGLTVEKLGLELEMVMVRAARKKGWKHWEEGMIWFDRI